MNISSENMKRKRQKLPLLDGQVTVQGLPILLENKQGSTRKWGPGPDDKNYMHYSYGYIADTKGWDGDEVDVYLGANLDSPTVFIVTQMKSPKFDTEDEQKVFIGFDTIYQVREAYLNQYNDPRFLGSILAVPMSTFKDMLRTQGSTLKALNTLTQSARLGEGISKGSLRKKMSMTKNLEEAIDILKSVGIQPVVEPSETTETTETTEKALRAAQVVGMAKQSRLHEFAAGAAQDQPAMGTNRERPAFEPPVVPVRRVETPYSTYRGEDLSDCTQCGLVYKSIDKCPRCAKVAAMSGEALPFHLRGR